MITRVNVRGLKSEGPESPRHEAWNCDRLFGWSPAWFIEQLHEKRNSSIDRNAQEFLFCVQRNQQIFTLDAVRSLVCVDRTSLAHDTILFCQTQLQKPWCFTLCPSFSGACATRDLWWLRPQLWKKPPNCQPKLWPTWWTPSKATWTLKAWVDTRLRRWCGWLKTASRLWETN